ncbi:membrane protein [Clostridium sp. L74]|nr:membrane protein [Clostridium sp. L74]
MAIMIRTDREELKFEYSNNKLKIVLGILNKKLNIVCDKVALVHIEKFNNIYDVEDFSIILLTTSKFRNKRIIKVNEKFLKLHNYAAKFYYKLKRVSPEKDFYYTIIKRGGLKKYYLLDALYRTCVYAHFTEECIEKIKELRKEIEID